ncbi:MAG: M24 family metallopeptidase [Burkholderiales bacterium]|nr:M24 family metallopeptidase [Burkholderiales bacterium]
MHPLNIEPRLQSILQQEYPRFSDAEYTRRHAALAAVMDKHRCDHLLVVTDHRAGNAPQWVTGWPGTAEAYVIFRPGERMVMHMEWHNHVPLARRLARDVEVRWGEQRGIVLTVDELKRRGAKRIGVIGPLVVGKYRQLEAVFDVVALDGEYTQLRMRKSAEELDWLRIGAALSDAGMRALVAGTRPGLDERELAALVEAAYIGLGGTTMIHYIGVTAMDAPQRHVPPQYASTRKVRAGDIVTCELSAYWWDYPGQILRSFTVEADATPRYRELYAVAEATFDAVKAVLRHGTKMAEILEATALIERSGYTICDDLVHGFGGGYFQPIIGSKSRMAGKLPEMTLEENMTVVVQPNPVTTEADESIRSGVQVGELLRITRDGCETLHRLPRGLFRAGQII